MRQMRRIRQQMEAREIESLIARNNAGVLALIDEDDKPYSVPMTYVYEDGRFYFHSANKGHKVDAIKRGGWASFCIIDQNDLVPEEYTTYFRSIIARGPIEVVVEDKEKQHAIEVLSQKIRPGFIEEMQKIIKRQFNNFIIIRLDVEEIAGKKSSELIGEND